MLKFSKANAKIQALSKVPAIAQFLTGKRKVYSLDLLSGYSCPHAKECLSKVVVIDNKKHIQDGPLTQFRCFSASQEVIYTPVYNMRKHNFEELRTLSYIDMFKLISESMPHNLGICRIHVAGDFFNQNYFDAWLNIAQQNPSKLFYAYTKSLLFWLRRKADIPSNFVLTASYGGKLDSIITEDNLRYAKIVYSEAEAISDNLAIDHTDEHAANPETSQQSFALMIHGIQPKGSLSSKAISVLKRNGVKYSYNRKERV